MSIPSPATMVEIPADAPAVGGMQSLVFVRLVWMTYGFIEPAARH
jgi:hypothetical protein